MGELNPKVIVDLGVDYGFSSFTWAREGVGTVYGVDSFEGDPEAGFRDTFDLVQSQAEKLNLTNLRLIKGYFSDVAATWTDPIDILHIDGRHRYEDVKEDYANWSKFVRAGGVILLHDTSEFREPFGVHRLFAEIDLPKCAFTHSAGLGVVSTDAALIRRIRSRYHLWLTTQKGWHMLARIGRRLKKMIVGPPKFDF